MNEMLLNLLAAQTGGNPAIASLVAQMRAISSGSGDPQELIAQIGANNPMLQEVARNLMEQRAAAARETQTIDMEVVEQDQDSVVVESDQAVRTAALEQLRAEQETMRIELGVLRERNDLLAAALGACCLCWGQDLGCRSCRGRGGPGFSIPDESLFEEYVLPAVQTFRAQRAKFRKAPVGTQPEHAPSEARFENSVTY